VAVALGLVLIAALAVLVSKYRAHRADKSLSVGIAAVAAAAAATGNDKTLTMNHAAMMPAATPPRYKPSDG
jgi:hypothetical protein